LHEAAEQKRDARVAIAVEKMKAISSSTAIPRMFRAISAMSLGVLVKVTRMLNETDAGEKL
jgi:hypothetical protein